MHQIQPINYNTDTLVASSNSNAISNSAIGNNSNNNNPSFSNNSQISADTTNNNNSKIEPANLRIIETRIDANEIISQIEMELANRLK